MSARKLLFLSDMGMALQLGSPTAMPIPRLCKMKETRAAMGIICHVKFHMAGTMTIKGAAGLTASLFLPVAVCCG